MRLLAGFRDALSSGAYVFEGLVLAALPVGEPIVQYGPFVAGSRDEIKRAMQDFQLGRNGFDVAQAWHERRERAARGI